MTHHATSLSTHVVAITGAANGIGWATAQLFAAPQAAYTRDLLDAIPLPDPNQVWL